MLPGGLFQKAFRILAEPLFVLIKGPGCDLGVQEVWQEGIAGQALRVRGCLNALFKISTTKPEHSNMCGPGPDLKLLEPTFHQPKMAPSLSGHPPQPRKAGSSSGPARGDGRGGFSRCFLRDFGVLGGLRSELRLKSEHRNPRLEVTAHHACKASAKNLLAGPPFEEPEASRARTSQVPPQALLLSGNPQARLSSRPERSSSYWAVDWGIVPQVSTASMCIWFCGAIFWG